MHALAHLALAGIGDTIDQSPVVGLVLSAIIGGLVGASIKFGFEDLLRPFIGWRRETRDVVRRYTAPLLRSAEQLERRINESINHESDHWFEQSEYFRLSTLYVFGEYFGWVRILERSFGFLPFESSKKGERFYKRLHGVFRALTSHAYFRKEVDQEKVGESGIQRLMLSAIGETMISPDQAQPIEFTVFATKYANDAQFRQWFLPLEEFLEKAHPEDPLCWDRLILTGAHLRALIRFLDPRGSKVRSRNVSNLHHLKHPEAIAELREDFPELIPSQQEIERERETAKVDS